MQLVGTEITSVPAKTASTNIGAAHHRRVCISVFETFYDTSTALAKATERLLRCDIAGQRSEVGPGAAVVLAPDLTGRLCTGSFSCVLPNEGAYYTQAPWKTSYGYCYV